MNRTILLKTVLTLVMSVALSAIPEGAFAQRGGHGGMGGFHGGGVGSFHGGYGGFHGGGYGGFSHAGYGGFYGTHFGGYYGGWHGGYRGYPGFGGWGWGISFGFGSYWGWGYPYYFGSPWWGTYAYSYPYTYGYPYQYGDPDPYYGPNSRNNGCDYRYSDHCPDDGQNGAPPRNIPRPNVQAPPAKPASSPTAQSSSDYRVSSQDYRVTGDTLPAPAKFAAVSYTFAEFKTLEPSSEMRPAVRNVVESLRAMPPDVRKRELSSGRYAGLSPEEKQLLLTLLQSHGQE